MSKRTTCHRGLLILLLTLVGCGSSGATDAADTEPGPDPRTRQDELPPPGYGTLRQDDFTINFETADRVQVKVTPLSEEVIRLAAPDTYERLHRLVASRQARLSEITERAGLRGDPLVLLISFFTRDQQKEFEPTDIQILSQGILYRPLGIVPLTPNWGRQQLRQEESQSALYVFNPAIDLDVAFQVEYRGRRSLAWSGIIGVLDAERGRVLSRAKS